MNFHYNEWLTGELTRLQTELELTNYKVKVEDEQFFLGHNVEPNTIYVVIKRLSSSIQFNAEIIPLQIMILSEQDGLDKVKILFDTFANRYNWNVIVSNDEYIKEQYTSPVVLSNFNEVAFGYRSVLYMTANLTVMDNVVDIEELKIDNQVYTPLSFGMSYSMTPNTQQKPDKYISNSVKSVSSFNLSISIPSTLNSLIAKVVHTMSGLNTGNEDFNFKIVLKGLNATIEKNLKLISASMVTAPNQVPNFSLGFVE